METRPLVLPFRRLFRRLGNRRFFPSKRQRGGWRWHFGLNLRKYGGIHRALGLRIVLVHGRYEVIDGLFQNLEKRFGVQADPERDDDQRSEGENFAWRQIVQLRSEEHTSEL